jgi:hypothetical protein
MGSSLSTAEIADSLGTTARVLRKFLRSSASPFEPVGQGARYNIDADDLVELKELFGTWVNRPGSRSTSKTTSTTKAPRKPKPKIVEKVDPLAEDDLMTRMTKTVAERQRMHGVICSYSWKHPKVKGLEEKCNKKTVNGTKFCEMHPQIFFCGNEDDPVDNYCGPGGRHPKPFCKYHNAEISDEELAEYLARPLEEQD